MQSRNYKKVYDAVSVVRIKYDFGELERYYIALLKVIKLQREIIENDKKINGQQGDRENGERFGKTPGH
jgi:hypothetical protein